MEEVKYLTPDPLTRGVKKIGNTYTFTFEVTDGQKNQECGVVLYKKGTDNEVMRLPFCKGITCGNVMALCVKLEDGKEYDYNFYAGESIITDPYAKAVNGTEKWGKAIEFTSAALNPCIEKNTDNTFGMREDAPKIPLNENIIYRLHVRGFTKSKSSKVKNKGTFAGLAEKAEYLKELGVNMVELMPAYDFFEIAKAETKTPGISHIPISAPDNIINYWGYTDAFYFSPKAAYSSRGERCQQVEEFKNMVNTLHKAGIEVCMEFYFVNKSCEFKITCLKYWVMEYGIDAIKLTGVSDEFVRLVKEDAILGETKVFCENIQNNGNVFDKPGLRRFASCHEGFLVNARRFLKGDEDQVGAMCFNVKNNPSGAANINYIVNNGYMTIFDTVSYDHKHNEANGENNHDGAFNNYSWNCGIEGPTRKRKISDLRKKQIKNIFSMLLLSQGVPMIYAGDEFGNTQEGNSNPYCQDNEISYLNWTLNTFDKEILEFTKSIIAFRKSHPITHLDREMHNVDYLSKGFPDMSYHGTNAWYQDSGYFNRHFSVMLCGAYAGTMENVQKEDDDIFIAYNMHWEDKKFDIPSPRSGKVWKKFIDTGVPAKQSFVKTDLEEGRTILVGARSVVVLISSEENEI